MNFLWCGNINVSRNRHEGLLFSGFNKYFICFTGHYIHMGSFKSRMENETARLYSPVYSSELSGGSCFIFWYYMSGGNTGNNHFNNVSSQSHNRYTGGI